MNLFGLDIHRAPAVTTLNLEAPHTRANVPIEQVRYGSNTSWWNGWPGFVHEPFAGAWQRNIVADRETSVLAFSAVFSCVTGIAADIGKMRMKLDRNEDGIWTEVTQQSPFLTVLRRPNHYQNRIKFLENWIVSKLLGGAFYGLKQRDQRGVVTQIYPLNPYLVTPLVAESGDVFYELKPDNLSGLEDIVTVPASEMIHDPMVCLWHPLVGVSPIFACGVSATMGNRIQANSMNLFGNGARPGGIISTPRTLTDAQAQALKERWEAGYSGLNVGKVAILGDDLKFQALAMNGVDAQLIEQLKWTVEDVARAFHYPIWKLTGTMPPYSAGPEAVTMMYYTDCLQPLIESIELCLDEGLELPTGLGCELDLDSLLRMDTAALYSANNTAVGGGWMSPNEARFRANLGPVKGGEEPLIQQQNWQLSQLAEREAPDDAADAEVPESPEPEPATERQMSVEDVEFFEKELALQ